MATIQEVGTAILSNKPGKLYVFGGEEYGLKCQYIKRMKDHYGSAVECESGEQVLNMFKGKRLIPLTPCVYIVRYDEKFLADMNDKTAAALEALNIIGTVVFIYQAEKDVQKCMKYLPNYTVRIDKVNPAYVAKYLKNDFPALSEAAIKNVISVTSDYNLASNICNCLQYADKGYQNTATPKMIAKAFGYHTASTEQAFKLAIAARDFNTLLALLDEYEEDMHLIFYTVLSTMLELEKLINHKFGDSPLLPYVGSWNVADIYYMFNNAYLLLQQSRKYAVDISDSLVYLFSLLRVSPIPDVGVFTHDLP